MPKMKTNRAAAKRFKKKAGGKIKRAHAFKRHILTKKSPDRKRRLTDRAHVERCDMREVLKLLPH
jgi:large subunit ribosomal protein L35